jgi:hypothetical protein
LAPLTEFGIHPIRQAARATLSRTPAQAVVGRYGEWIRLYALGMPDETDLDFSLLPDDLQHLAPLIARYAESDDTDRSKLLANASADDLRVLSTAAEPHWDAINAFLDDNMELPGPRQDLAIALDGFSQAAMEARNELEEREAR